MINFEWVKINETETVPKGFCLLEISGQTVLSLPGTTVLTLTATDAYRLQRVLNGPVIKDLPESLVLDVPEAYLRLEALDGLGSKVSEDLISTPIPRTPLDGPQTSQVQSGGMSTSVFTTPVKRPVGRPPTRKPKLDLNKIEQRIKQSTEGLL